MGCETMGNATNICSDKTGTLTENRMTVVAGWMNDKMYEQDDGLPSFGSINGSLEEALLQGIAINSTAILEYDNDMKKMVTVGSKTEGALLQMVATMGKDKGLDPLNFYNIERFKPTTRVFSFSSGRKLSSVLVPLDGGGYRLYVKGASEIVLGLCEHYWDATGQPNPLDDEKRAYLSDKVITHMARDALRTIAIAHVDFSNADIPDSNALEDDWGYTQKLTLQAIVGIIDPLRPDVVEAVKTCQEAGIMVRMVTGDNIETAKAIAKRCGILTEGGEALEGPTFRKMTPAQLDKILPKLQVLARSSPDDKHTLVTRLNGKALPKDQKEWEALHPDASWEEDRNKILPGYYQEWRNVYGSDGEVVGVTGDGTNDAPALKAGDVGLSMGLSGTDVAKEASDIVIMDDTFASIVQAVKWGRSVYDNIRKFLQFQLTVNVVALLLVFLAACLIDGAPPLNAVMMLWVNLIMDTMGALALGTEQPTDALLDRLPYKRNAALVTKPMWRNILMQSALHLFLLLFLLFHGADLHEDKDLTDAKGANYVEGSFFDVPHNVMCESVPTEYKISNDKTKDALGEAGEPAELYEKMVKDFGVEWTGYESCPAENPREPTGKYTGYAADYSEKSRYLHWGCRCAVQGQYAHYTIIFNAFVYCQIFNEFNARSIGDDIGAAFRGLHKNAMFAGVIIFTVALQLFMTQVSGNFTRTTALTFDDWLWSVILAASVIPMGVVMRLIPVAENPDDFANTGAAAGRKKDA